MPNILALDISSTAIGWCYLQDDRAPLAKSIALGGKLDIAARCAKAQAEVSLLLAALTYVQMPLPFEEDA